MNRPLSPLFWEIGMRRLRPSTSRTALSAAVLLVSAVLLGACASGSPVAAPPSSSDPNLISTAPGVVKDSIEDVNSTKDMTGVVTTYSGDDNPYFDLIPQVCPFLPDQLTQSWGMTSKSSGFGTQHRLLQTCNMQTDNTNRGNLAIVVSLQAVSIEAVATGSDRKIINGDIALSPKVRAFNYKIDGNDSASTKYCNVAWGTFYGTAVVTVRSYKGYAPDPCKAAVEYAREVQPLLPSRADQMRPTE